MYIHEESHRKYIRKLLALAFIPTELISQTFQALKDDCPVELHALSNYFENYWIDVVNHKLWNMYGVQRRTNNLEGWHLRLNQSIGKAHANIYEFVSKLITEQRSTESLLTQIAAGSVKTHNNNIKYKQINEKIKNLTIDFSLGQKNEYLTGIAYNIAQPTSISL